METWPPPSYAISTAMGRSTSPCSRESRRVCSVLMMSPMAGPSCSPGRLLRSSSTRTAGRPRSPTLCAAPVASSSLLVSCPATPSWPRWTTWKRPSVDRREGGIVMGLIGGMARTAVVAGTATAVSNRVSRRQANRWSNQEQQQYDSYQQPQPQYAPQPQYGQPAPVQQYAPPEPAAPP